MKMPFVLNDEKGTFRLNSCTGIGAFVTHCTLDATPRKLTEMKPFSQPSQLKSLAKLLLSIELHCCLAKTGIFMQVIIENYLGFGKVQHTLRSNSSRHFGASLPSHSTAPTMAEIQSNQPIQIIETRTHLNMDSTADQ